MCAPVSGSRQETVSLNAVKDGGPYTPLSAIDVLYRSSDSTGTVLRTTNPGIVPERIISKATDIILVDDSIEWSTIDAVVEGPPDALVLRAAG